MDKKTIWIVVGCIVGLVVWQRAVDFFFPPKPRRPAPVPIAAATATNRSATATALTATGAPPTAATPTTTPPTGAVAAAAAELIETPRPRAPEQILALENDLVRVEFTSWGGGIRLVELRQHKAQNHPHVTLHGAEFPPALSLPGLTGAGPEADYELVRDDEHTVTARTRPSAPVPVTKRFTLGADYVITGTIEVSGGAPASTNGLETVIGTATPVEPKELPDVMTAGWLVADKYKSGTLKKAQKSGPQTETGAIQWGAVSSQFFALVLTPATNAVAIAYHKVDLPPPPGFKGKQPPQGLAASLGLMPATVGADGAAQYSFALYAGPKEYSRLLAMKDGQEAVMQFGFFGAISVGLLKSMVFFHRLIPNYGVAIIIITILIKLLFWPIQAKSIKSMKEMQKFQPLMTKLREKYKDQPQKLNEEMMKLYKEHKINPLAGCLPMAVQIPVFFAFYTMLRSAVELRGAGFVWIHDLSQPDTIAQVANFPLNPLPLAMGLSMLWQMKLTPSGGDPKQQQMMLIMPVVFLFICYNMSSGLVLYWTVQQFLSIAQQWWSLRQPGAPLTLVPGKMPAGKAK